MTDSVFWDRGISIPVELRSCSLSEMGGLVDRALGASQSLEALECQPQEMVIIF